jgi:sugar (pentulose or hexulose) kinase
VGGQLTRHVRAVGSLGIALTHFGIWTLPNACTSFPTAYTTQLSTMRVALAAAAPWCRPGGLALGLDFGTEAVRAVLVGCGGEGVVAQGEVRYRHGQISRASARDAVGLSLSNDHWALQHPTDWCEAVSGAVSTAFAKADGSVTRHSRHHGASSAAASVGSIGVDFTSCTMLPVVGSDAEPLCRGMPSRPHAWPKLWKHHGAGQQAKTLTDIANGLEDPWLAERCVRAPRTTSSVRAR